jgi:tRNA(Ile)-lysidine synthase
VLAYLESLGQSYRTDRTNLDLERMRNRIRHQLLPLLASEYNPAIVAVLGRLAGQAERRYRRVAAASRKLLAEVEKPRAGDVLIFDRPRLAAAPRHLIREVFRRAWQREGWPTGKMSFAAWDRLAGVALGEVGAVDLPGGLQIRAAERVVQLGPKE